MSDSQNDSYSQHGPRIPLKIDNVDIENDEGDPFRAYLRSLGHDTTIPDDIGPWLRDYAHNSRYNHSLEYRRQLGNGNRVILSIRFSPPTGWIATLEAAEDDNSVSNRPHEKKYQADTFDELYDLIIKHTT